MALAAEWLGTSGQCAKCRKTRCYKQIAMAFRDMNIDLRHMQLLADVMTYKGEVLGITRFGLSKTQHSVLQLASFEKTADHLFDAAAATKRDRIKGVSESVIMGQTMNVGTGAVGVVRKLGLSPKKLPTEFEDLWGLQKKSRKRATFSSGSEPGWGT